MSFYKFGQKKFCIKNEKETKQKSILGFPGLFFLENP
jgi:hypothetical protein